MNSTEKIVEAYFRLCMNCFTMPDIKIINGNNRQIDLLAYNLIEKKSYHVETSVTHCINWCPTPLQLTKVFDEKFFGVPTKKEGKNTDYMKGKDYQKNIFQTYEKAGLFPQEIIRVWVCWTVKDNDNLLENTINLYCQGRNLIPDRIQIISFRDKVLPTLLDKVSTSNYEDDMLRTLSLIRQYDLQKTKW